MAVWTDQLTIIYTEMLKFLIFNYFLLGISSAYCTAKRFFSLGVYVPT
jgi:hypothetical protein